MTELIGQRECFLRGHSAGYAEALEDIEKELQLLGKSLNSVNLPIIEGLLHKLETKQEAKNA